MALVPKFGSLDAEATQNLYACTLNEGGEPQAVSVSIDLADDAIQWNRRTRQFVYKCRHDEGLLLVPESLLGSQAEAESFLASITAARGTGLAPVLLAGLPHKVIEAPASTTPTAPDHSNAQQHQAALPAAAGGITGISPSAAGLESVDRELDTAQVTTLVQVSCCFAYLLSSCWPVALCSSAQDYAVLDVWYAKAKPGQPFALCSAADARLLGQQSCSS